MNCEVNVCWNYPEQIFFSYVILVKKIIDNKWNIKYTNSVINKKKGMTVLTQRINIATQIMRIVDDFKIVFLIQKMLIL